MLISKLYNDMYNLSNYVNKDIKIVNFYIDYIIQGAVWKVNYEDKRVRQILSKTNIIGQAKRKLKESI